MSTYSFHQNGFWFHLSLVQNTTFVDQHGMNWYKAGNVLTSEGGGFSYTLPAPKPLSNEDYFMAQRELSRIAYVNRMQNL